MSLFADAQRSNANSPAELISTNRTQIYQQKYILVRGFLGAPLHLADVIIEPNKVLDCKALDGVGIMDLRACIPEDAVPHHQASLVSLLDHWHYLGCAMCGTGVWHPGYLEYRLWFLYYLYINFSIHYSGLGPDCWCFQSFSRYRLHHTCSADAGAQYFITF